MKKQFGVFLAAVLVLALSGVAAFAAPAAQGNTPQSPALQTTPQASNSGAANAAAAGQSQAGQQSAVTLRANRVFGYQVVNLQGTALGQVEDMILEVNDASTTAMTGTSDIRYFVVGLTNSGKRVAVPATATRIDPQVRVFAVDTNLGDLQSMPGFDSSNLPAQNDVNWDAQIRSFWQDRGATLANLGTGSLSVSARELMRYRVTGPNDQDLGQVQGLILQFAGDSAMAAMGPAASGQGNQNNAGSSANPAAAAPVAYPAAMPVQSAVVRYAIVSTNATGTAGSGNNNANNASGQAAVPLTAVTVNQDARTLSLNSKAALQDVPSLNGQTAMNNPNWDQDIQAYWIGIGIVVPGVTGQDLANPMASGLYYRASRLIGFAVIGADNNELGEVEDLIVPLDMQAGATQGNGAAATSGSSRMGYALIGVGGFLGLGEEYVAIPLTQTRLNLASGAGYANASTTANTAAGYNGYSYAPGYYGAGVYNTGVGNAVQQAVTQNAFLINMTQADFDNAPRLDLGNVNLGDPNWDANLRSFWEGRGATYGEVAANAAPVIRASSVNGLTDYNLTGTGGDDLGEVEDFLVHFQFANGQNTSGTQFSQGMAIQSASVRYALVQTGGFLGLGETSHLVPLSTLQAHMGDNGGVDGFTLPVTQDQLDNAPAFDTGGTNGYYANGLDNRYMPFWQQFGANTTSGSSQ